MQKERKPIVSFNSASSKPYFRIDKDGWVGIWANADTDYKEKFKKKKH